MHLLIVNGPNLNLLGSREEQIYGNTTFEAYLEELKSNKEATIDYLQSNVEGELINFLQNADCDAIILNAGGYTHTSVALHDCIKAIQTPVIEVHISNIAARESFRHDSLISPVAAGCIFGMGMDGYALAVDYCQNYLNKR
jgi:3-dehydroquinate dehydratase-2